MGGSTETLPSSSSHAPSLPALRLPELPAAPVVQRPPAAPTPPANDAVESHFWLTRRDQMVFGLLSLVALALCGLSWLRLTHWGTRAIEIERMPARQYEYRIDANSATWVEWSQIQGIGDGLARRIVGDREQNGPFNSVDDLSRVKGIGPKTLEHLRPWVRVSDETAPSEPPKRKRAKSRQKSIARS
jgi:competence protein ComEA